MLPGSTATVDYIDLSGIMFAYTGTVQQYIVPAHVTDNNGAVDSSGVAVTYVNVWMSGAGGGYGSRAHPEQNGELDPNRSPAAPSAGPGLVTARTTSSAAAM